MNRLLAILFIFLLAGCESSEAYTPLEGVPCEKLTTTVRKCTLPDGAKCYVIRGGYRAGLSCEAPK